MYISDAYSKKFDISKGDTITVKESYGDKEYSFHVSGIYEYPSTIAIFMDKSNFNEMFNQDENYFNGYFSNTEIKDIDDLYIATVIT